MRALRNVVLAGSYVALLIAVAACDEDREKYTRVVADEEVSVSPSGFQMWDFFAESGQMLDARVRSSRDVNVWLLQGTAEFTAFARGEDFYAERPASRDDITDYDVEYRLPATDQYYFVVDNRGSVFQERTVDVYLSVE
ncbi:hypothetical protein HN371_15690 [Candidatus Poribacteria bacterium]|jgi:hypothetical protein|nr:hypothetical protein [Candidatus Poribacteria bacterium]MBT5531753.1 hypothetical protein [Candidatus Poribacteria bacterium]MBT5709720.1 hypothetical protein [Candidatus Poribacteria bacterium]MBT7100878.1 hypothetical protein [Candidatus Poribacteria bacterium]MBT7805838.1 hypothetical protein [Candidatus Poribacteria bacterium]